jgi:hypothetical protein
MRRLFVRRLFVHRLAHWALALAVGLLAPGGYVHALAHLDRLDDGLAKSQQDGGDAGVQTGHACELCAAYAAADGGATAPIAPPLVVLTGDPSVAKPAEPSLPSLALTRFASRAPPLPY